MQKFREDSIPEKLRNMVYKKLKGKYQILRAKLCKQTIFRENKHKEFFKDISG